MGVELINNDRCDFTRLTFKIINGHSFATQMSKGEQIIQHPAESEAVLDSPLFLDKIRKNIGVSKKDKNIQRAADVLY